MPVYPQDIHIGFLPNLLIMSKLRKVCGHLWLRVDKLFFRIAGA